MVPMTAEREELIRLISNLRDDDVEKVVSYAGYLRHLEEQEDAEDIAAWEARKDEPVFSLAEVKASLDLK